MAPRKNLSLVEAMIYCLTTEDRGLTVPQIAYLINRHRLHVRKDGEPVTERQVWAAFFRHPEVFVWEGGIIHLLM